MEQVYEEALQAVLEWFQNKGCVEGVFYDEASIVAFISDVLEGKISNEQDLS